MNEKQTDKLIKIAKDLSDIVNKYQRYMKPREADKARQMKKLIKQILQIKKITFIFASQTIDYHRLKDIANISQARCKCVVALLRAYFF